MSLREYFSPDESEVLDSDAEGRRKFLSLSAAAAASAALILTGCGAAPTRPERQAEIIDTDRERAQKAELRRQLSIGYTGHHAHIPEGMTLDPYFYGEGRPKNVPGTYVDSGLHQYIGSEFPQNGHADRAIIKWVGGKQVFAYYDHSGRLDILSITSTGKRHYDGGGPTPSFGGKVIAMQSGKDMWHASQSYDNGGIPASMPYSKRMFKNVYWIHQGLATGVPESHGCVRLPGLYAKRFFEQSGSGTTMQILI